LFNTAETPPLAVGSLVMQNYPEQQQYAAVTRVYRLGRWVADVTWHRPEGNVPDLMQDVDSLVVVTREQLDAVTPPLAVAAEGHAGKIVQAIVSRWAGHFTVRCSCLGSLEVCRDGRQIGWSRTQQSAQRLWEWHTAGEQGPAPAAGAP
jgi:hypothetical protein